ncbi:Cytosine-specific methyltransferase [uncultured Thiomicrorhabdus sp.]
MIVQMSGKTYIDLFSGCGGLALGLHKAGWRGVFAVEKSVDAFKTLEHNLIYKRKHFDWPKWLPQQAHDINELISKYKNELKAYKGIDLVAGGPPCQGFSMAGRRKHDDLRNQLAHSYLEFVRIVQPKKIFFENVLGFTLDFTLGNGEKKRFSSEVEEELVKMGYSVKSQLIDFSEYGVPQKRTRYILVGTLDAENTFFSELEKNKESFLNKMGLKPPVSLKDAIGDLLKENGVVVCPDSKRFKSGVYSKINSKFQRIMRSKKTTLPPDSHRFANHRDGTILKLKYGISTGLFGKNIASVINDKFTGKKSQVNLLDPRKPSPTLTTLTDDYIHYCEPRNLTVREYARIQSFPDDFHFLGAYTTGGERRKFQVPRYTQIGNAIPPIFAEQAGIALI